MDSQQSMDVDQQQQNVVFETTKIAHLKSLLSPVVIDKVLNCEAVFWDQNQNNNSQNQTEQQQGTLRFFCSNKVSCTAAITLPRCLFSTLNTKPGLKFSTFAKSFVDATSSLTNSNCSTLRLNYEDPQDSSKGGLLTFVVEEQGVLTEYKLRQLDKDLASNLGSSLLGEAIAELVLKPEAIRFLVANPEQDQSGTVKVEIAQQSGLKFMYEKPDMRTQVEIPTTSAMVENFVCEVPSASFTYQYAFLKPVSRALNAASKVSLRVDKNGFMCIQVLIENARELGEDSSSIIDYFIVPDYY